MSLSIIRFGLIVTGRGEAEFLPKLFRAIMAGAHCTFAVIRKSAQLSPITSPKRGLQMVGRKKTIPTIEEEQFGLPAHRFLRKHSDSFVLVIDDLEIARRSQAAQVFARYRDGLDAVLGQQGLSGRASVHFLVNMLEAYYFADAQAVNIVAGFEALGGDHVGDVETIPHPKHDLKAAWPGFDELQDGREITSKLNLQHVLANPDHCCWLRTLFAWCIDRLNAAGAIWDPKLRGAFQLVGGCRASLTDGQ